jgi:hypothetical protein
MLTKLIAVVSAAVFCTLPLKASAQPVPTVLFPADLVILLDDSGSIDPIEWSQQTQFARDLVNSYNLGPTNVNIAVGAFGTTARSLIDLSASGVTVVNAIATAVHRTSQSTCLTCAFEFASAQFETYGRAGSPRATIVFTDGQNNVRDSEFAAQLAHLQSLGPIFAIGLGDSVPTSFIELIASDIAGIQTSFFTGFFASPVPAVTSSLGLYAASLNASPVTPIPEPETYAMLLAGLALLGVAMRRRNN